MTSSVSNVVSLLDVEEIKNREERGLMLQVAKITEGPPYVTILCTTAVYRSAEAYYWTLHGHRYDRPAPAALKAYIRALRFNANTPPPPTPLGACHRALKELRNGLKPSAWKTDVRVCCCGCMAVWLCGCVAVAVRHISITHYVLPPQSVQVRTPADLEALCQTLHQVQRGLAPSAMSPGWQSGGDAATAWMTELGQARAEAASGQVSDAAYPAALLVLLEEHVLAAHKVGGGHWLLGCLHVEDNLTHL